MMYDAFAELIGQSGDALLARQESASDAPRVQREGRQIATFLRRTRAVWGDLFSTLGAETEILERGLETARETLRTHALEPDVGPYEEPEEPEESDPLERYRAVNRSLDVVIERLTPIASHSNFDAASRTWAADALHTIRGCLSEASETQGRLIDRMLEVR
jgi:hypothetical protein